VNKKFWEEADIYFHSTVSFYVGETITNSKITVTVTMQLLVSVYMIIYTAATATALDAWVDSLLFPNIYL
jgi:hypothetical protein